MRYFPQHVLLCTSTVHDQSASICIQGYLRILWIGNTKSSKIDKKFCLKLEYFFKSCKTYPLNATSGRAMSVKKRYMEPQHGTKQSLDSKLYSTIKDYVRQTRTVRQMNDPLLVKLLFMYVVVTFTDFYACQKTNQDVFNHLFTSAINIQSLKQSIVA